MGKHKPLNQCQTWNDFEQAAIDNGIRYDHTTGGHDICKCKRGSITFSTHERGQLSKGMCHKLAKEILALIGIVIVGVLVLMYVI